MDKLKLLATGLSGLVGSKIAQDLQRDIAFENLDLTTGVDITNAEQVRRSLERSEAKVVLHLAAFTDVKAAWEQRGDRSGSCFRVNVLGTEIIAQACREYGKHLIHVSTAFVFDGSESRMYTEDSGIAPIEWYGQTKAEAEAKVREYADEWTIFRIDQPFRADDFVKPDTTHKLLRALLAGAATPFADHWFSPTIIEDFAQVVLWAAKERVFGVWHATCGRKVSDLEYAELLARAQGLNLSIAPGSLDAYLQNSNRPYQRNTALSAEKLRAARPDLFTDLETALRRVVLSTQ